MVKGESYGKTSGFPSLSSHAVMINIISWDLCCGFLCIDSHVKFNVLGGYHLLSLSPACCTSREKLLILTLHARKVGTKFRPEISWSPSVQLVEGEEKWTKMGQIPSSHSPY